MDNNSSKFAKLKWIAPLCTLIVLMIIGISAYIRLSGNGLGCSPWPNCFGEILQTTPQSIKHSTELQTSAPIVFARGSHRILAVVLLPLLLLLIFIEFNRQPKNIKSRWLSGLAVLLVIFLAVLGRWTSGKLMPAITLGNLIAGFLLLSLCWRLSQITFNKSRDLPLSHAGYIFKMLTFTLLVLDIALGGLVSSNFIGLSCPSLIDCLCQPLTNWNNLNIFQQPFIDPQVVPKDQNGITTYSLHLYFSIGVAIGILGLSIHFFLHNRKRIGIFLLAFICIEFLLGFLINRNELPLLLTVLHNLIAAILLAVLVSIG